MSDLIKREDAIETTWKEPTYADPINILTEVRDRIEAIPSADRPQGEWEERPSEDWISIRRWYCSECGEWQTYGMTNYCPNCGCRMKGADDEA